MLSISYFFLLIFLLLSILRLNRLEMCWDDGDKVFKSISDESDEIWIEWSSILQTIGIISYEGTNWSTNFYVDNG